MARVVNSVGRTMARDVLRPGPTGPRPWASFSVGASFSSRLRLNDHDPDNFNGQILFSYIFSEKKREFQSACQLTKVVRLYYTLMTVVHVYALA
ncbi:hypothetical protein TNCV_2896651 [Trichonephila clavipes]|nr:hypothetical protein TNCV_2896651 [Trichonephila clavipes]